MKQEVAARLLEVSQASVSRLEAGHLLPDPQLQARIEALLKTRDHLSQFEHWLATVRHSPGLTCLLQPDSGGTLVVEIGEGFSDLGAPFDAVAPGHRIPDLFGNALDIALHHVHATLISDPDALCLEGLWSTSGPTRRHFFKSAYTPVRDDEGTWYLHSSHSALSQERYLDYRKSGLYPRRRRSGGGLMASSA